jgi:hypothetical protein
LLLVYGLFFWFGWIFWFFYPTFIYLPFKQINSMSIPYDYDFFSLNANQYFGTMVNEELAKYPQKILKFIYSIFKKYKKCC